MRIDKIVVGQLEVNCYIVSDESIGEAMIIDPGDEFERIADLIEERKLKPKYIVFTHAHYDHVCAAGELRERYKAAVVMHEDSDETYRLTQKLCISWGYEPGDFPPPDIVVKDGDTLTLGDTSFRIIYTPGHAPGSICLYGDNLLFTGDTLFRGSVGRADLPGGDFTKLMASLGRLTQLPPDTQVFCGHAEETTIAHEIENNPFLNGSFRRG